MVNIVIEALFNDDPTAMFALANLGNDRLGIILDSYTVYLDLVVCDLKGRVLAHGRPQKFPNLRRASMADQSWFQQALATKDGAEFAVADVYEAAELDGASALTKSGSCRSG